ncbi:unnamed protein product [Lampetra planeri]
MHAIGVSVGQDNAVRCQKSAAEHDPATARIAACASCNEIQLGAHNSIVDAGPVDQLGAAFRLTDQQVAALGDIPAELVVQHQGPDQPQVQSGHDYGRHDVLPKLNGTTLNAVLPARAFNIEILVRSNHSTAHAIVFPSDVPVEVAKQLPIISDKHLPQLTFLGPRDAWCKAHNRFRALY